MRGREPRARVVEEEVWVYEVEEGGLEEGEGGGEGGEVREEEGAQEVVCLEGVLFCV